MSEIVASKMKSHTIAESVILSACQQIVRIMFGEEAISELSKIPLSDNTISRYIHDMSENIECNIKSTILKHKLFALEVDESTDITGKAQLLVFIRFIDDEFIVEDFLCCKELPETNEGQSIFDVINLYLEHCELKWKNCVGICTDGAPSMTGGLKDFVFIAQNRIQIFFILTALFIEKHLLLKLLELN